MITKNKQEFLASLPEKGKILALDIGAKKTGIAICDEYRRISSPHSVVDTSKLEWVSDFMINHQITGIIIGYPVEMSGNEGEQCKKIMTIAKKISKMTSIPIYLLDERLSTKSALHYLSETNFNRKKKQELDDKISANILLMDFLQS